MITPDEIAQVAARFEAPEGQVIRDHLISHVLAAVRQRSASWCSLGRRRDHRTQLTWHDHSKRAWRNW